MWFKTTILDRLSQFVILSINRKRLFDKLFIAFKPLTLSHEQKKVNLSFVQYLYSPFVKINKAW